MPGSLSIDTISQRLCLTPRATPTREAPPAVLSPKLLLKPTYVIDHERKIATVRTVQVSVCTTPQLRFLCNPPKSFFKKLFIGTELGRTLLNMSTVKALPEGLKQTECERNLNYCPAVLYIPEKDPLAEAITDKVSSLKIQLPGASELYVSIWHSGTQEEFLIHVQNAKSAIYKKGWTDTYNTEEDKVTESETSTESSMTVQEARTELTKRKASIKQSKKLMSNIAAKMFQLYVTLLSKESRSHWDKIVTARTASDPWIDIYGDERDGVSGKTYDSFQDCVSFHLQLQFKSDAAETQQCYIRTGLKKPSKVPVRQFFLRIERLNGYLATLPCLYFSPQRNATTKLVKPYEDAELADILLCCCPRQP